MDLARDERIALTFISIAGMGETKREIAGTMISVTALTDRREHIFKPLLSTCDLDIINSKSDSTIYMYFITTLQAVRSLCGNNSEVILCKNEGIIGLIAVVLGWIFHKPVVIHIGGDIWKTHRNKLSESKSQLDARNILKYVFLLIAARVIFSGVRGAIAVSPNVKKAIVRNTEIDEDDVWVIPVPIDVTEWESKDFEESIDNVSLSANQVISTVTNLHHYGKYSALQDALVVIKDILEQNPNAQWVIAGDGMYRDKLITEADRVFGNGPTRNRLHIPGYIQEISQLYTVSDVFVYLSYEDGYPNAVIEAQASGTPVIANSLDAMVNQINNGETGYIIEQFSDLPEKLDHLLTHENEREYISERAKEKLKYENNMSRIGERMSNALYELCSDR
jgi:glycosyltransferase involved in cell wall biosynthesis